jgi:hypothetical protein
VHNGVLNVRQILIVFESLARQSECNKPAFLQRFAILGLVVLTPLTRDGLTLLFKEDAEVLIGRGRSDSEAQATINIFPYMGAMLTRPASLFCSHDAIISRYLEIYSILGHQKTCSAVAFGTYPWRTSSDFRCLVELTTCKELLVPLHI